MGDAATPPEPLAEIHIRPMIEEESIVAHAETAPTEHPLRTDTQVTATAEGRFRAVFSNRWNALGGVINGGYSVAMCLRALSEVLPHPDPLVVSTFFLGRGVPGPVEIETDITPRGRRTSTGEGRLFQDGREIVRTVASFTDLGEGHGRSVLRAAMPDLPPPETAHDLVGELQIPGVTIAEQVEFRFANLPGWRQGKPSGEPCMQFWMRFVEGREVLAADLPMLVDAAAPAVLELRGVASSVTLELTTHVRARPAEGWLACRVSTRYVTDGYHEEDFEIWDSEGNLVAQSRQLALLLAD